MGFWGWVLLFLGLVVAAAIVELWLSGLKKKGMLEHLSTLPNFSPSQQIMGVDGASGIAIDESRGRICLLKHTASEISSRVIPYRDILSVELFQDGESVTKTSRVSQIGGAIVGGLALGGVGAIIGGLSGSTKTSEKIKRIDLRIIANDIETPLHDITFMNVETGKDGIVYTEAMKQARHWSGIMEVVIRRADMEKGR